MNHELIEVLKAQQETNEAVMEMCRELSKELGQSRAALTMLVGLLMGTLEHKAALDQRDIASVLEALAAREGELPVRIADALREMLITSPTRSGTVVKIENGRNGGI